jgi:hypothetical protein
MHGEHSQGAPLNQDWKKNILFLKNTTNEA